MDKTTSWIVPIMSALSLLACVDDYSPDWTDDARHPDQDAGAVTPSEPPQVNLRQARGAGCDLTGRWIMSERRVSDVLSAPRVTVSWSYVELAQRGERVTMAGFVDCGRTERGLPIFDLWLDDSAAWPAYATESEQLGRIGTSLPTGNGCDVSFERSVVVRGATVSSYRDEDVALPGLEQPARGEAPGWEDWDRDGKPGITVDVSGVMTGRVFEVSRTWSELQGRIARDAGSFMLHNEWGEQRVTLGADSPMLAIAETRSPIESEQFVELTRLMPTQAMGDAASQCQSIRQLAPILTPNATRLSLRD